MWFHLGNQVEQVFLKSMVVLGPVYSNTVKFSICLFIYLFIAYVLAYLLVYWFFKTEFLYETVLAVIELTLNT